MNKKVYLGKKQVTVNVQSKMDLFLYTFIDPHWYRAKFMMIIFHVYQNNVTIH